MTDPADYFRCKVIAELRSELFPSRQAKFDEWAKDKPLTVQLEHLVADAMKGYREPDVLKGVKT